MTDLTGKVALVTGGARGIGQTITERLAHLGARVVVNYSTSEASARETVTAIRAAGGEALAVKADVSSPAEIERLFTEAIDRFGRLDIVVANAGVEVVDQAVVDLLAKEIGGRGVTVNSILPTATQGAGVSTDGPRPQVVEYIKTYNPMGRMGTVTDVADAVEYLVGPLAGYVSGQHLLLSGGAPA